MGKFKKFLKKADKFWRDPADVFGGQEREKAAKKQAKAQEKNVGKQTGLYDKNAELIAAYGDQAAGAVGDARTEQKRYLGDAGRDLRTGARDSLDSLKSAYDKSYTDMRSGYDKAREGLQSQADLAHYGEDALTGKGFETSGGYQFRLNQGNDALAKAQAASGGRISGAALKKMGEYNEGFASNEYNNWANRASNLGQVGYGAQRGIADYYAQEGQGLSALDTGYGDRTSAAKSQLGQDQANLSVLNANAAQGYGQNLADIYGREMAGNVANTGFLSGVYNNEAGIAGMTDQAAANLKGQQANMAASIIGGIFGGVGGSKAAGALAQNKTQGLSQQQSNMINDPNAFKLQYGS